MKKNYHSEMVNNLQEKFGKTNLLNFHFMFLNFASLVPNFSNKQRKNHEKLLKITTMQCYFKQKFVAKHTHTTDRSSWFLYLETLQQGPQEFPAALRQTLEWHNLRCNAQVAH